MNRFERSRQQSKADDLYFQIICNLMNLILCNSMKLSYFYYCNKNKVKENFLFFIFQTNKRQDTNTKEQRNNGSNETANELQIIIVQG